MKMNQTFFLKTKVAVGFLEGGGTIHSKQNLQAAGSEQSKKKKK